MEKEKFITNSIIDIQNTIRTIDLKIFGTITFFLIPITEFEEISLSIKCILNEEIYWLNTIILFSFMFWVFGILISFMGLFSIKNPAKQVLNRDNLNLKGIYYSADNFKINISEIIDSYKQKELDFENELIYEKVKLTYIRDLKIIRQRMSALLLAFYIIFLITILISHSILFLW
jgi:hypothetical protein